MSEFKTFGLDEARVLVLCGVTVEVEHGGDWSGTIKDGGINATYRLIPEQELTFEQACLLVGLGLRDEMQEFANCRNAWTEYYGPVLPDRKYRTRPLTKQAKIIPHTMETAPAVERVEGLEGTAVDVGDFRAHVRSDGQVMLIDERDRYLWTLSFEEARHQLVSTDTGKPYGREVEA